MPPSQALANGPLLPDVSQTRDVGFPTGANELSMSAWKKGWLTDPLSSVMYCHNLRYFFRWNFLLVFVQISYSESAKQQLREAAEKAVSYLCLKEKVDPQIMTTVCARAIQTSTGAKISGEATSENLIRAVWKKFRGCF